MSIAPVFSSPCEFAHRMPHLVATFLDLEEGLGRRFREDSLTDIIIASLLSLAGNPVVVQTPIESRTGSDFDLALVDLFDNKIIQYRVQAKRLIPHESQWDRGSYRELDHRHGSGSQVNTLTKLANLKGPVPTIPLYAFYNPGRACSPSGGKLDGIALADAFEVKAVVEQLLIAKAANKRPPLKRVANLCPLLFPLSVILCPGDAALSDAGASGTLTPDGSIERVRAAVEKRRRTVEAVMHRPQWPKAGREIPADIRKALAGREDRPIHRAPVERPRVVLLTRPAQPITP